ncbi:MAG: sulfite exporter TauE/SafE family protein [Chloroflexi bacterium]|nr:MAG: sulfite exporter TauE/SafE family protein [Chloroflexota bacterium]
MRERPEPAHAVAWRGPVDPFALIAFLGSITAGAIATVAGFGIGSVLTPLLGTAVGVKLGVALASIPHVAGTALRLWIVRADIDRRLLLGFGVTSAAGGLAGAALQSVASSPALTVVFSALLLFAGFGGITGYSERLRFGPRSAWIGGALSGFLGGLVGNQGGIRSAAMLGFSVRKQAFVATSTAVALIVDGARVPVYVATQGAALAANGSLILTCVAGVVAGTVLGTWLLRRVPEPIFRRVVGALLVLLGLYTLSTLAR